MNVHLEPNRKLCLQTANFIKKKTDSLLGTKLISLEPIQRPITHRFRLDTHGGQKLKKLADFFFVLLTFIIPKCEQHCTDRNRA